MIALDGSAGEGGGQILRTALGLAAVTGQPFQIRKIRAKRDKPGLLRQHLAGVRLVARLCGAELRGAELGSSELVFVPGPVPAGEDELVVEEAIGSAGSTGLVLQAALPLLLRARRPVTLVLSGGTHNPSSPPAPFLVHALVPALAALGARVSVTLEAAGFFPAGGGRIVVRATPAPLSPVDLPEGGEAVIHEVVASVSNLPDRVPERELAVLLGRLGLAPELGRVEQLRSPGPGNALWVRASRAGVGEVFTSFGQRGRSSEAVAEALADEVEAWRSGGAPVGEHLADQLLVPLALAGGGSFRATAISSHTRTNAEVVSAFLPVTTGLGADGRVVVRPAVRR